MNKKTIFTKASKKRARIPSKQLSMMREAWTPTTFKVYLAESLKPFSNEKDMLAFAETVFKKYPISSNRKSHILSNLKRAFKQSKRYTNETYVTNHIKRMANDKQYFAN